MSLTSEKNHEKLLSSKNIRIRTLYSDGNDLFEKNTDNSKNDTIEHGIRVEKDYYINNKLVKRLFGFDPRIDYSFINSQRIGENYTCPNCGMTTVITDKSERCEYCDSYYNLDYKNKNRGSKNSYDLVMHNKKYIRIALIVILIASLVISYIFFKNTSRTYNIYDVLKTVGVGLGAALILFFIFYIIDSLLIILPIKLKKQKINRNDSSVWTKLDKRKINYNTFYNNLYYELDNYYYVELNSNIIDYDVIDFYNFNIYEDASNLYLSLDIIIREVYLEKDKIKYRTLIKSLTLKKNNKPTVHTDDGEIHMINCHNCGASIDVNSKKCKYCDTPNNYNQEWYLTKIR